MARPTIKIGVKFESSQEASAKLQALIKQLEGANKGLKLDLGLDTASKTFKEFSGILEKMQKQMQGMTLKINGIEEQARQVRGLGDAIGKLNEKSQIRSKKDETNWQLKNAQAVNKAMDEQYNKAKKVQDAITQMQNTLNSSKNKMDTSSFDAIQSKINSIKTDMPENEFKVLKKEIENDIKAVNQLVETMAKMNQQSQQKRNTNDLKNEKAQTDAINKSYEEKYKLIQKTQAALDKAKLKPNVDTKEVERLQKILNGINTNTAEKEIIELRNQINMLGTTSTVAGGTFRSAFGQMAQMVGIFNVAYMGMNMLRRSFREGFEAVKQMDSAMTTLSITMKGLSSSELSSMATRSQEMATELYSTSNTVMEAVKTFANASESIDSIFEKTSSAVILSNLTGLDIQTTVDTIQSAVQQFDALADGSAESSMKVADSMVAISKSLGLDFSKGIKEMSESLNILGSLSQQLGGDIDSTLAIIAAGMEKMRVSGSEMATSLKTILTRTMRIKSEGVEEKDWSKAEKALDDIGIKIRNLETGEMRNFMDIMRDISKEWDNMDGAAQMMLGESMGI